MPTGFPLTSGLFTDTAWLNATGARRLGAFILIGGSNVDFIAIPATYKHLLVTWKARSNVVAVSDFLGMRINGDVSNHYLSQELSAAAAVVTSIEYLTTGGDVMGYVGKVAGASAASGNDYGCGWLFLPNYNDGTSFYPSWLGGASFASGTATGTIGVNLIQGQMYPAAIGAVTRLTFLPKNGTAFTGSSFTLYGLG